MALATKQAMQAIAVVMRIVGNYEIGAYQQGVETKAGS